jgi:predicted phage gp36 major capsid-like protein
LGCSFWKRAAGVGTGRTVLGRRKVGASSLPFAAASRANGVAPASEVAAVEDFLENSWRVIISVLAFIGLRPKTLQMSLADFVT